MHYIALQHSDGDHFSTSNDIFFPSYFVAMVSEYTEARVCTINYWEIVQS